MRGKTIGWVLGMLAAVAAGVSAQEEWVRRDFDAHGVSMEVPPRWAVDDSDEQGVVLASNPAFIEDEDSESAVVAVMRLPLAGSPIEGISTGDLADQLAATWAAQGYTVGELLATTIDDGNAFRVSMTMPVDERSVAGDYYITIRGADAYIVFAATMPDSMQEQYRPAMERIVYSLRFSSAPTASAAASAPADLDLLASARNGDPAAMERALDAGADIDARDHEGRTALIHAARRGPIESMETLIAEGADLDAADGTGRTALMFAVSAGSGEKTRALLDAGADPFLRDRDGSTALDLARELGYGDVAALLEGAQGPQREQ